MHGWCVVVMVHARWVHCGDAMHGGCIVVIVHPRRVHSGDGGWCCPLKCDEQLCGCCTGGERLCRSVEHRA